jgi:MFS transporter, CP family, cyanate transporter
VITFAGLGALTPSLAHRVGSIRLLVAALVATTAGLVLRAVAGSVWLFVVLSLVALSGGAVSNVLLPSLVKRYFPDRIGRMTALYTTALAVGTTLAAGLTVPVGDLGDGWRLGLGSWAILAGLAVLPWLPTARRERSADRPDADGLPVRRMSATRMLHSRTAWALTIFFGFQSMQAYIGFGWYAKFLHAHSISSDTAGWMVALFSALSIPVSMYVPTIAPPRLKIAIAVLCACSLVSYVGLAIAPVGGAWWWMVFGGLGSGTFPIALTMIGLRSRNADSTAALSSFVQAIGYVIAGLGPLLFGVLNSATDSWALPLTLLFVALALTYVAAMVAARPRYVDDELVAA